MYLVPCLPLRPRHATIFLALFLLPVATAHAQKSPEDSSKSASLEQQMADHDPFGDREEADGAQEDPPEAPFIPAGQNPDTSEVLPQRRAIPIATPPPTPTEPVRLRFRYSSPLRYDFTNTSRMGFEDKPNLRQIYRSGMAIEYRPLTELERAVLPQWRMKVSLGENATEPHGQIVLATVFSFSGTFEEPHELTDSARTHQILKDAAFSYRISDQGDISDLRIHPPTNPLARSSLEDVARLLGQAHPIFPDEPVEPGATWERTISLSVEDRAVVKATDITLTYSFDQWDQCGIAQCAIISVEQEVKAAGRLLYDGNETRSASAGSGSGQFVFDYKAGEIRSSRWNLSVRGDTKAMQRAGDQINELAAVNFHLEVDTTVSLLDRSESTYELVSIEDDEANEDDL